MSDTYNFSRPWWIVWIGDRAVKLTEAEYAEYQRTQPKAKVWGTVTAIDTENGVITIEPTS